MIVVAITQRLVDNPLYPEQRECLDVRWGSFCASVGLLPLVLPIAVDPAEYLERFAPAGLILTGGNDLASAVSSPLSERRDAYEKRLLAMAVARELPVFAVCRGMQLVAEHFGASVAPVADHTRGVHHDLTIDPQTRYGAALSLLASVRSYHDYAVTKVPEGFVAVARSQDGVLEAMAHTTRPIYCQMWHPEREDALTQGETALIRELFSAKSPKEGT